MKKRNLEVIGWREYVGLPDLELPRLRAKIDTGARTSALHALDQKLIIRNGEQWVDFLLPVPTRRKGRRFEARVVSERNIKNTSGVPECRLIILTTLLMGAHRWTIEVSLANRKKMEFDLILGRTAIRGKKLVVDPGRSYQMGKPTALPLHPNPDCIPAPLSEESTRP